MPEIAYTDPRQVDGTSFDVAKFAVDQALAVGELYEQALKDVFVFARNSEMQREIFADKEPNGVGFPSTPLGAKLDAVRKAFPTLQEALIAVGKAASYNPKHPPVAGDD